MVDRGHLNQNLGPYLIGGLGTLIVVILTTIILAYFGMLSISWETSVDTGDYTIPVQTINTVLGVILGFFASTVMHLYISKREKDDELTNIRKSLLSELYLMSSFFEDMSEGVNYDHPASDEMANTVSTNVYQTNTEKIGRLDSDEAFAVVTFYTALSEVQTLIRIAANTDPDETKTGDISGPSPESIMQLNRLWFVCIAYLENNIPKEERPPKPELFSVAEAIKEDTETRIEEAKESLKEQLPDDVDSEEFIEEIEEIMEDHTQEYQVEKN